MASLLDELAEFSVLFQGDTHIALHYKNNVSQPRGSVKLKYMGICDAAIMVFDGA